MRVSVSYPRSLRLHFAAVNMFLQCLLHETATFGLPKSFHEKVHLRKLVERSQLLLFNAGIRFRDHHRCLLFCARRSSCSVRRKWVKKFEIRVSKLEILAGTVVAPRCFNAALSPSARISEELDR